MTNRRPNEVAELLYQGVLAENQPNDIVQIITDEKEALRIAIEQAQTGDVIAVFFDKMEPLIEIINEYVIKLSIKQEELIPV